MIWRKVEVIVEREFCFVHLLRDRVIKDMQMM